MFLSWLLLLYLLLLLLRYNSLNKIGLLLLAGLDIGVERLSFRVAGLGSLGCSGLIREVIAGLILTWACTSESHLSFKSLR